MASLPPEYQKKVSWEVHDLYMHESRDAFDVTLQLVLSLADESRESQEKTKRAAASLRKRLDLANVTRREELRRSKDKVKQELAKDESVDVYTTFQLCESIKALAAEGLIDLAAYTQKMKQFQRRIEAESAKRRLEVKAKLAELVRNED